MGGGEGAPLFLHDARVYLSQLTVLTTPAGTVTTNSETTNAPLVVRTLDDAIRAAIELHDLPAPDDGNTSVVRSEEHTSELQSHLNLVCRLLLEKKTTKSYTVVCGRS